MNKEARIAFIISQSVCAMAEIEGMKAENEYKKMAQEYPIYIKDDFKRVIDTYNIGHNAVIEYFTGRQ